jgi:hypothetical protein
VAIVADAPDKAELRPAEPVERPPRGLDLVVGPRFGSLRRKSAAWLAGLPTVTELDSSLYERSPASPGQIAAASGERRAATSTCCAAGR